MQSSKSSAPLPPLVNDHRKAWLEVIHPGQWSQDDVAFLKRLEGASSRGILWSQFNAMLAAGALLSFRITGAAQGVWIVQLVEYQAGRELTIWGCAGRGVVANLEDILSHHIEIARGFKCRWVSAYTEDLRILKVLQRKGMKAFQYGLTYEVGGVLN